MKSFNDDSNMNQDLSHSDNDYIIVSNLDHKFDQAVCILCRYGKNSTVDYT